MSKQRDAAAAFIDTGRALATAEVLDTVAGQLAIALDANPDAQVRQVRLVRDGIVEQAIQARREAGEYQLAAERLMNELDSGGALARRLLRTLAAARAAWRER
jgi:hypothetical protein